MCWKKISIILTSKAEKQYRCMIMDQKKAVNQNFEGGVSKIPFYRNDLQFLQHLAAFFCS